MKSVPTSITNSMQGLAFWIGYQHSLLPDHELLEGAAVAELYRLLSRYLDTEEIIKSEQSYSQIADDFKGKQRADVVVAAKKLQLTSKRISGIDAENVKWVVEVKRAKSPVSTILNDIERLSKFMKSRKSDSRAFLLLFSQSSIPKKILGFGNFLDEKGNANPKLPNKIKTKENQEITIRLRRVCKATSSFLVKSSQSANYVLLFEVFE